MIRCYTYDLTGKLIDQQQYTSLKQAMEYVVKQQADGYTVNWSENGQAE